MCTVVMTNKNLFNYTLILLHTCVCVTNSVPQTFINCIFYFYLQDWFLPLYLLCVKLCNRTRLYLIDDTLTINYLEYYYVIKLSVLNNGFLDAYKELELIRNIIQILKKTDDLLTIVLLLPISNKIM